MTTAFGARIIRRIDAGLSALLRYDLSHTDVVKWVLFARQILMVLLLSVVTIAGLSAYVSTRQAKDLLENSLASEARAIADAVARASFVPLTLEDNASLTGLVDSYRTVERLGSMRIIDAQGAVRASLPPPPLGARLLIMRVPVLPVAGQEARRPSAAAIGAVEVGMRRGWIDAKTREIALTNVAVAGSMAIVVWILGLMIIRNLIDRTRELVGEARLVAQVKLANAELETFAYSVAHDLRAPLRAIDGFSQVLLGGYSDKLDDEGRHYLTRLRENSKRMGQLISDLLGLSRLTRAELRRADFDLAVLARAVDAQLRRAQPDRNVEFVVPPALPVNGDQNLMLAALENLLGNAWKYTSRNPRARVELGRVRRDGADVYFVRDDGAGFDMEFAAKLFKPFSRLHSPGEFEGTGIGLATVHRIVARHGGRIWGESQVGKGAAFYFTMGETK